MTLSSALYGAFEVSVIAAVGGWAIWHTATRVFKLRIGRRATAPAGGCGSGCGGCSPGGASCGASRESVISVATAPSARRRSG